jgi:hypothetical protein
MVFIKSTFADSAYVVLQILIFFLLLLLLFQMLLGRLTPMVLAVDDELRVDKQTLSYLGAQEMIGLIAILYHTAQPSSLL